VPGRIPRPYPLAGYNWTFCLLLGVQMEELLGAPSLEVPTRRRHREREPCALLLATAVVPDLRYWG
jgi:hypothetical protein